MGAKAPTHAPNRKLRTGRDAESELRPGDNKTGAVAAATATAARRTDIAVCHKGSRSEVDLISQSKTAKKPKPARTKRMPPRLSRNGSIRPFYQAQGITLYRADCLDVLTELPATSIDSLITDPPYAIVNRFGWINTKGFGKKGIRRLQFDWDGPGTVAQVAFRLRATIDKLIQPAGTFIFCGFDAAQAYSKPFREAGFTVKPAAWVKKCPPPAAPGNWWPSGFELAFYAYRRGAWFADRDVKRSNVFIADSYRFGQPGKVGHPTQKPLGLVERLVTSICPPGGLVLDPFLGSGTTALGCLNTGRRCIGIEKEAKYLRMAVKRIESAERQSR